MQKRRISVIAFYDAEFRILLQDRRSVSKAGEQWGFFGGKIEEGETPEQALRREIHEELNYTLGAIEFVGSLSLLVPPMDIEIELYLYIAPLPPLSQLTIQEGDGYALVSIAHARAHDMLLFDAAALDMLERVFSARGYSTSGRP